MTRIQVISERSVCKFQKRKNVQKVFKIKKQSSVDFFPSIRFIPKLLELNASLEKLAKLLFLSVFFNKIDCIKPEASKV